MRFLGVSPVDRVPDACTIWRFPDRFTKATLKEDLQASPCSPARVDPHPDHLHGTDDLTLDSHIRCFTQSYINEIKLYLHATAKAIRCKDYIFQAGSL